MPLQQPFAEGLAGVNAMAWVEAQWWAGYVAMQTLRFIRHAGVASQSECTATTCIANMGHGIKSPAQDQVTVSSQVESGRRDLGLQPAPPLGADPIQVCGTIAEKLYHYL